jgi:hypothetical protein
MTIVKRRIPAPLLILGLAAALLANPAPLSAALGESADSVAADREALGDGAVSTTVRNGYTVQEIRTDAVVLREYISSTGVVFAIAWNGLIHPDLKHLLGSYLNEYETALRQTQREAGRRQLRVMSNRVVVEKWGHMRALQGRAYVPNLIPPGVSVDEIE